MFLNTPGMLVIVYTEVNGNNNMKVILDEVEDKLYYKWTKDKYIKIVAILTDEKEVNPYLEKNKNLGLLFQAGSFYFLADLEDV